jgi:outer membrane receptor protein involved in Fe transport
MIRADAHALLSVLLLSLSAPAAARGASAVAVPAGPLDRALASLSAQTGIDIGSSDPGIPRLMVPGLCGRMTAAQAIDRLLRGTPFRAERIDARTFRLYRAPPPRPPAAPRRSAPPPPSPTTDIVVTAAKTMVLPLRFPGAVTMLRGDANLPLGRDAPAGMGAVAAVAPIVQETALGAGRNKLFIRGVADSSFSGPTQSTAAVYWGDVSVAYSGADPGLTLYDVDHVEILEGPQGTLYGAGAIGGVIRVVPRLPDLAAATASVGAGMTATRDGRPGTDLAGTLNLPLVHDALGLRVVGYRTLDAGYIDDVGRGRGNVNNVRTGGGRLSLRAAPAPGWTVDLGLLGQHVVAADLQYAERGLPRLARATAFAQPFRQDYTLGHVRLEKGWDDGLRLVSATGYAVRDSESRFDATRKRAFPLAYDTDERSRLLSHETRLSRSDPDGAGWLVGISASQATDHYARRLGVPERQRPIVGTSNRTTDLALFGQVGWTIAPPLILTAGARLTHQRSDGDPVGNRRPVDFIAGRSVTRIDPTLGLSWRIAPTTALYARYQSGFRAGGVAIGSGYGKVANIASDTIRVAEAGIRHLRAGPRGFAGTIGLSDAHWTRVQADLVDRSGFPFTANIGDSRIVGVETTGSWIPVAGLMLTAAAFVNDTRLSTDDGAPAQLRVNRVPNTPALAASGGIGYDWHVGDGGSAAIGLDGRYVGPSTVGTLAPFDLRQRGFGTVGARAAWRQDRGGRNWRWSLSVDNLLNAKGDRFASGNPFAATFRDIYTPLRPRSVRLGLTIASAPPSRTSMSAAR